METISLLDGLTLTVVSMLVVFIVLASLWGITDLVAYIIRTLEAKDEKQEKVRPVQTSPIASTATNKKNQKVAEVMALILASEDEDDKKFEIVESVRIK